MNYFSFQKIFPIPAESQPLNWRSFVVSTFWILGSIFWIMNGWATYLKVVNWLIDGGSRTCQRRIRFPEGVKNLNLCTAECWSWSSSRWAAFQSSQSFRAAALKFENAPQREIWREPVLMNPGDEGEFWRRWILKRVISERWDVSNFSSTIIQCWKLTVLFSEWFLQRTNRESKSNDISTKLIFVALLKELVKKKVKVD